VSIQVGDEVIARRQADYSSLTEVIDLPVVESPFQVLDFSAGIEAAESLECGHKFGILLSNCLHSLPGGWLQRFG
jgi:hypothetical protein